MFKISITLVRKEEKQMYIVIVEQMHGTMSEHTVYEFDIIEEALDFVNKYASNCVHSCRDRISITMPGNPLDGTDLKDD